MSIPLDVVALVTIYFVTYQLSSRKIDPQEPPIISPKIPVVDHLLGMAIFGGRFSKNTGIRNKHAPVFTLPVPSSRIYIVTQRILGFDNTIADVTRRSLDSGPGGERVFPTDILETVYSWLGPGDYLSEISLDAACEFKAELLVWVRHLVTVSTAKYLYGLQNPIALHPHLEDAFWDFYHGLGMLLINIFPRGMTRKAYKGQELPMGSKIIQERIALALALALALKHGWTLCAAPRPKLSFLSVGIVNASTFWILLSIYIFKTECPMLVAVYRECLRLNSDNNSIRVVKEPTLLADRYFLAIHPAAFRASGGGKTLCPGRHYAMNEILALVVLVVLLFDMESPDGGGIEVPKKNNAVLPVHVLQ
ncbi:uncharacterized protein BCR38DRAFT_467111 [Pseudomassariella vexata]|uniref:Cytochrome P450 n=1 Tax=Pseudomassariella vexata TaxID=1141098 RepID=A0A1Y2DT96_9PEZI|nr:uncharacterized protein BCR38DRAFT_467111 [Pseudomassariella vexata]ORY62498.1 hypothetical protein BCR38DRAFT_467111 [Pseudomassariella vexata]